MSSRENTPERPYSEIPGPSVIEMARLTPKLSSAIGAALADLVERHGPMVAFPTPGKKQAVVGGASELTRVFETERHLFLKKAPLAAFDPLGKADPFVEAGGEAWQQARRAHPLAHDSAKAILDALTPALRELVRTRTQQWAAIGSTDAWEGAQRLAFDFIATVFLGHTLSETCYTEFLWIAKLITTRMNLELVTGAPPLWPKGRVEALLDRMAEEVERASAEGPHLLHLMQREGLSRTPRESGRMLLSALLAGGLSAPAALLRTVLAVCAHPEQEARIRAEIDVMDANDPDAAQHAPTLEGALREAVRLDPPVPMLMRNVAAEQGAELGGYRLPQGTCLWISNYGLHRSREIWTDPESFHPERWTPELLVARPFGSESFFPFGRGPRSCLGQDVALRFVRLTLSVLFGEWQVQLDTRKLKEEYFFACSLPKSVTIQLSRQEAELGQGAAVDERPSPSLPQHDPDPAARAIALRSQSELYEPDLEKLSPLVMCRGIPEPEQASVRWFLEAGSLGAAILMNMAANKAEAAKADTSQKNGPLPAKPAWAPGPAAGDAAVARAQAFLKMLQNSDPDQFGSAHAPPFVRMLDKEPSAVLRDKVDSVLRYVLTGGSGGALGIFEEDKPIYGYRTPGPTPRASSVDQFAALHRHIPPSPAAEALDSDEVFARRRITGPNPALLQCIDRIPDHFPVTDAQLRRSTSEDDSLEGASAEGRLFLLDHAPLDQLLESCESSRGEPMYFYSPLSLFALPREGGALRPVAIQCGQRPNAATPVLTPADGWSWSMARYAVEVAEICLFEAVTHLGLTHLLMEPAALATRRFLAPNHPLARLLTPHFEGTISVNDMAVNNLAADRGAIDQTFGASIESIRQAAAKAVLSHDLRAQTLPATLHRQGLMNMERLPDHPFRDDSLRIRGAIERWVRAYLRHAYPTEQDLAADVELRAWASSLGGPTSAGGLHGFGSIQSHEDLSEVVTELVFIASAGHAAVNFPQWTDASYAPRMSGSCWAPAPRAATGYTEADWLAMLPPLNLAELHGEFTYLLGQVYYTQLGHYHAPGAIKGDWFVDPMVQRELLPTFQRELSTIEEQIKADNADPSRRSQPYRHLLPSLIPQSINI